MTLLGSKRGRLAVWPDDEIKSSPNYSRSCPKCFQCSFCMKSDVFNIAQKSQYIWATFVIKHLPWTFKNRPIWSHCLLVTNARLLLQRSEFNSIIRLKCNLKNRKRGQGLAQMWHNETFFRFDFLSPSLAPPLIMRYFIFYQKLIATTIKSFFSFIFRRINTQLTVYKWSMLINFCRWLDSNRGPLVLEVTALPTEPQPLPND